MSRDSDKRVQANKDVLEILRRNNHKIIVDGYIQHQIADKSICIEKAKLKKV